MNRPAPSVSQLKLIHTGSTVIINQGVEDPITGCEMSGWQGRVLEIAEDDNGELLALIQWNSHTLKKIPANFIEISLAESLNWAEIAVSASDIAASAPSDTQNETDWARAQICNQYIWNQTGKQGRRIRKILTLPENENAISVWETWENYLKNNLVFPFDALVTFPEEIGPLKEGDSVMALSLAGYDEKLGQHILIKKLERQYILPITDIQAVDPASKNFQLVDDYTVWFANH